MCCLHTSKLGTEAATKHIFTLPLQMSEHDAPKIHATVHQGMCHGHNVGVVSRSVLWPYCMCDGRCICGKSLHHCVERLTTPTRTGLHSSKIWSAVHWCTKLLWQQQLCPCADAGNMKLLRPAADGGNRENKGTKKTREGGDKGTLAEGQGGTGKRTLAQFQSPQRKPCPQRPPCQMT